MKDPEIITPFIPARYSEEEGHLAAIMAGRKVRAKIGIGTVETRIRLYYGISGGKKRAPQLALFIRGRLWQLAFGPTRCFYDLLEQADPHGLLRETPAESIPGEILMAIVESLIGPLLSRLEAVLGEAVSLADPDPDPEGGLALPLGIGSEDARVMGWLYLPEDGLDLLEKLVAGSPRETWPDTAVLALEKQVSLQAGSLALELAAFSELVPGDVLLPDRWLPGEERLGIGIGPESLVCAMDIQAMTLAFSGLRQTRAATAAPAPLETDDNPNPKDNDPMANKETAGTPSEETAVDNTENQDLAAMGRNLALDLTFELGRTTMTVGEIQQLAQGQVIRLPVQPREGVDVDIRVNSQRVARGKIVSVGGDVGIQITEVGS